MRTAAGSRRGVSAVGVVVPARDEEQLLPSCLDALVVAADRVQDACGTTVDLLVVLDRCVDGSARVLAARPRVRSLALDVGNVGLARAAGLTDVVSRHGAPQSVDPQGIWLATTDADSRVPPDWLVRQVEIAVPTSGCGPQVYLAVGGFPGLALDEDVSMVALLAEHHVVRSGAIPVITSARSHGRLSGGFADHVAALG